MGLSHRIVGFISNLLPLYIHDEVDGVWCARSLVDGTLIVPMDEPEDYEEGFVTIHWQGAHNHSAGCFYRKLCGRTIC